MSSTTPKPTSPGIRLSRIKIKNFKAIDELELEFPRPTMPGDRDMFVIGSRNGAGKTSLLEACALLFLRIFRQWMDGNLGPHDNHFGLHIIPDDIKELCLRSGSRESSIEVTLDITRESKPPLPRNVSIHIGPYGQMRLEHDDLSPVWNAIHKDDATVFTDDHELYEAFLGQIPEPLVLPFLLYFHSYRRIREGDPTLGSMVRNKLGTTPPRNLHHNFKMEILRNLMSRAGFIANSDEATARQVLQKLDALIEAYAGGVLAKPTLDSGDKINLYIAPKDDTPLFPLDGLSSGQKEIISTFFMIWKYTQNVPGIVLIDEPELHLNAEWQVDLLYQLHKLAPWNQYIIASHSEDIFASAPAERRILLAPSEAVAS